MADIKWDHSKFLKSAPTKAMDGLEELARGPILSEAKEKCPVDHGTMRSSLGVERDDKNSCCYIGGGGAAKDYILRQHQDMSLNHPVGEAKFITNAVQAHSGKLKQYVEKHLQQ
jgi:hypothetical protein